MTETTTAPTEAPAKHAPKYTRNAPYQSAVQVNEKLTGPESEKETIHIELGLEDGMTYLPGDAVGIIPTNREPQVDAVLKLLGYTGDERVLDHYKVEIDFREALTSRLAIGKLTRSSINQLGKIAGDKSPKSLQTMLGADGKALAEEWVYGREFHDLITEFPGLITQPQDCFQVLARLTPRMYSIASALEAHEGQVHTTVRVVRYHSHGEDRQGVCSGFMGERMPVGSTVPVFLHENNNFRLPVDTDAPVIMVGPGTGIAPFRSFLEYRQVTGQKGDNWLFFGEQRSVSDYLYKDQFQKMESDGFLTRLSTAFSRDQQKKVYVQDRMREHGAEVYEWLENGAHVYICGDATRMAKDVETALLDIIAEGSKTTPEAATEYLGAMKKSKRYQLDVY
jgi:sulfite reductase (NADPH) flavoprotein alpha-component